MSRLLLQNIHPFILSPLIATMLGQLPCPAEPTAHLSAPSLPRKSLPNTSQHPTETWLESLWVPQHLTPNQTHPSHALQEQIN